MTAELKPCPFCGTEPDMRDIAAHKHYFCGMPDFPGCTVIECSSCDIHLIRATELEAAQAWGRRVGADKETEG